jgi:hypothetical protein
VDNQRDGEAKCDGPDKEEFRDRDTDNSHDNKADREYDSGKPRGCIGHAKRPGVRLGGTNLHDFIVSLGRSTAKLPPRSSSQRAQAGRLWHAGANELIAYRLLLDASDPRTLNIHDLPSHVPLLLRLRVRAGVWLG